MKEENAPTQEEVRVAVEGLKNNKAPGSDNIAAELLKYGENILVEKIHELIEGIWIEEEMPEEWSRGIICPIHNNNDKTVCGNYRGITLLNITYKVCAKILGQRIKQYVENIVGECQRGFRPGRATTDQIFSLRQILEKCYEFNIDLYQVYIDFKQAYDKVNRMKLFSIMEEFNIPRKLIRLTVMTMKRTHGAVKIEGELSDLFQIKGALRQGDVLSTMLFNLVLEKAVRQAIMLNPGGNIFNGTYQYLAYADDVVIVSRNRRDLEETFVDLVEAAKSVGLDVNIEKTKGMILTRNQREEDVESLNLGHLEVERVRSFKYLRALIMEDNIVGQEVEGLHCGR